MCWFNTILILNNNNNFLFVIWSSRLSRYCISMISYICQQFHSWNLSVTHCHNSHNDSSIVQSELSCWFHVNSTLSNHAMMNHFYDLSVYSYDAVMCHVLFYQFASCCDSIHYSDQTERIILEITIQFEMILEKLSSSQSSFSEIDDFRISRINKKNKYSCLYAVLHSCSVNFTISDHAAWHRKKHTDEKSIHYFICNKIFTWKDNMKQYQCTHHTSISDDIMLKDDENEFVNEMIRKKMKLLWYQKKFDYLNFNYIEVIQNLRCIWRIWSKEWEKRKWIKFIQ